MAARPVDRRLREFVALLHRRKPPRRRARIRWRALAMPVAVVLVLSGLGALLWFPWPGLGSYFTSSGLAAMASVSPVPASTAWVAPVPRPAPAAGASLEPPRAVLAVPPAPDLTAEFSVLPPQEASRPLSSEPPLPPVPSLPPPVPSLPPPAQPVAMLMPSVPAADPPQLEVFVPAWIRNAVPAPAQDTRPRIAVVIDDVGLDRARSARAIALPGPLTLSFLPYATDLARQTEAARKAGHELLVHVPMEPIDKSNNAGPGPLDVSLTSAQILERLRWDLGRFDGYVGINNHMGSRFTSDADALEPVMQELRARGLLFIDSRTVAHSAGFEVASKYGVPHAGRDVFLDDDISAPAIGARLAELERVARRAGSAIAIGHPHDATLDALKTWLRDAPAKGFALVPVSAIVKERQSEG